VPTISMRASRTNSPFAGLNTRPVIEPVSAGWAAAQRGTKPNTNLTARRKRCVVNADRDAPAVARRGVSGGAIGSGLPSCRLFIHSPGIELNPTPCFCQGPRASQGFIWAIDIHNLYSDIKHFRLPPPGRSCRGQRCLSDPNPAPSTPAGDRAGPGWSLPGEASA
jgi:hypothetical protein